jgi:hypothetical protein
MPNHLLGDIGGVLGLTVVVYWSIRWYRRRLK